jgi:hypothetical protein
MLLGKVVSIWVGFLPCPYLDGDPGRVETCIAYSNHTETGEKTQVKLILIGPQALKRDRQSRMSISILSPESPPKCPPKCPQLAA